MPDQKKIRRMLCLLAVLPAGWVHEEKHRVHFTDAFRMSAPEPVDRVTASLNLKAYNLLREEFPPAMEHVQRKGQRYLLDIPVADYQGIGRFVLGLPGEVEVVGSETFKVFLKGKLGKRK